MKLLPTTHVVISHPIKRTDSKRLAMKIGEIQSHLRKLQIDMIENGNITVMRCAIWDHLYNLKNVKNVHRGMLILVKL